MLPSKPTRPIAPPYHARELRSCASMNRIAQSLGAPVTVTAHACVRNASIASKPSRRMPSTWSTVWMTREYISICLRPMTRTLPGTQIRDLSLRSTSVHIVSSDSSFSEFKSSRMFSASPMTSRPRAIVPEIGQVSTRVPSTRTYISGDAETRYSDSPRFMSAPYGAGFRSRSRWNTSDGRAGHGSKNIRPGTTSKRSPRRNDSCARRTVAANSPASWSPDRLTARHPRYGVASPLLGRPAVDAPSTASSYSCRRATPRVWSTMTSRSGRKRTRSRFAGSRVRR